MSGSLKIASLLRLNNPVRRLSCLMLLSLFIFFISAEVFFIYTLTVCCKQRYLIILMYFPKLSWKLTSPNLYLQRTLLNVFVQCIKHRNTSFCICIVLSNYLLSINIALLVLVSLTNRHYSYYISDLILLRVQFIRIRMMSLDMLFIIMIIRWSSHTFEPGSVMKINLLKFSAISPLLQI